MSNRGSLIAITLFIGFILAILPMPLVFSPYRPDWAVLILLYWILALPHRVNIGFAWLCGLFLDVLLGSSLGANALGCAVTGYITASNYQKIRNFSQLQQALTIGIFLCLHHLIVFWISYFLYDVPFSFQVLTPVLTDLPIWLAVFRILRWFRRNFRIK